MLYLKKQPNVSPYCA